jgi:hypothetical protein
MASSMNGAGGSSDSVRYSNYLSQLERQQDADIRDKEDLHKEKVTRMVDDHQSQESQIKKDYQVKISDEAEAMERKLSLTRERNNILISQEREKGEKEADRIRAQYQQKIEQEKKTGDLHLSRLQEYYKKAGEELQKQSNRSQIREGQKGERS